VEFYHLIFSPNTSLLAFQRGEQEASKKMNFQQRNTEGAKSNAIIGRFSRTSESDISPYGDAILKKLKLSLIACTNYFQLICLLKDL
jgi:hypothetical protein